MTFFRSLALLACLGASGSALAFDRPLPTQTFGPVSSGALTIREPGSTGDASRFSAAPNPNAPANTIARLFSDTAGALAGKAPLASPAFTGTTTTTALRITAPASSQIDWAGALPLAGLVVDQTAVSDTQQESGIIVKMTSAKGGASGTGALSAFKIPFGTEMTMLPGSGNGYAGNFVIHAKPGVGYQQISGVEINVDIENRAYPPTPGQPLAWSLALQGINQYPQTTMIFVNNAGFGLGQTPAGKYQSYEGIWFYGPYTVSDHTFRDDTNAAVSYSSSGSHSAATFVDTGTSPTSLNLAGTNSLAAIFTGNANTTNALIAAAGQKVCFNGDKTGFCMYYASGAGKFYLTNAAGANIMSVDGSGTVRAAAFTPGSP